FLDKTSPETEVRRLMDTTTGYDSAAWRQLAGDVGIAGLAVPEEYGGAGYGFVELGIFLEEAGRSLLCGPVMSTVVLATSTLLGLGDTEACRDYLPGIVAGTTVATLALTEPAGRWDADGVTVTASRDAEVGWRLDGTKSYVLDGHTASLLIVAARTDAGVSVFAVDAGTGADASAGAGAGAPGLHREPQATLDETRK
nr:acyl-CoA dehydrogenase family protein [Micromonospora sp. DSM 115978]